MLNKCHGFLNIFLKWDHPVQLWNWGYAVTTATRPHP